MTLTEFLKARIDEDENVALAAMLGEGSEPAHSANPALVLAECEAKRRIIMTCQRPLSYAPPVPRGRSGEWAQANATLMYLALPYTAHPDYRPDWAP